MISEVKNAILALEDGTIFKGINFGADGEVIGEVVFNTGMTGYQEVLTDPSYSGQIVTMTYPLIGNYGVNNDDVESLKPQVKGFIVREACKTPSNWRTAQTINDYLVNNNIIAIEGIDTRALTKILREKGTMNGIISTDENFKFSEREKDIKSFVIKDPVDEVTTKETRVIDGKGYKIALLDLGVKTNIIRSLQKRDCKVIVLPANTSPEEIMKHNPDGILFSNGPGDPKDCKVVIKTINELYKKIPMMGICLGHQIMALATGADTGRLKYGHRGCNHPVKDLDKDLTYITSQNHGYTIVENTVNPKTMYISHRNMNDNTIEGIRYLDAPVFTVQFHPEASPGPNDNAYLFDEFMEMIKKFNPQKEIFKGKK
ncbi:MAG: carbamoyl phosphate synthase small subunit [Ignavibacteriales bacterium]